MDFSISKCEKVNQDYRTKRSTQTGFASPATHYTEPPINLNDVLVRNASATFFVRVVSNAFAELSIYHDDVLIVDRSVSPTAGHLVLAIVEDDFTLMVLPKSQQQTVQVWGVVTYVIHQQQLWLP